MLKKKFDLIIYIFLGISILYAVGCFIYVIMAPKAVEKYGSMKSWCNGPLPCISHRRHSPTFGKTVL